MSGEVVDYLALVGEQFTPQESQVILQDALEHAWLHEFPMEALKQPGGSLIFKKGEGIYLYDLQDRKFIDALSGVWVVNVGHGREELARVAYEQMRRLAYTSPFSELNVPAIKLSRKLAEITPGDLSRVFLVNSGSEAVETALKIAKQYHLLNGKPKKYKVIGRRGSYHGTTMGAQSVNGSFYVRRHYFEPLLPGTLHVPNVQCYRCDYGLTYPSCNILCARMFEQVIQFENPDTVAAIIAEPISVSNGVYIPPEGYWETLREICDKYDVLLIVDEVICGFGRTGKWFAIEHFGVQPDIMTMAKGLSSGYSPIAATITRKHIADKFLGGPEQAIQHGITFGTHPVSSAVALANIQIIERERLVENAAEVGRYLGDALETLREHPTVGDVRGIGLLWAVEIVKDKKTKERFPPGQVQKVLSAKMIEKGLLCRVFDTVQIAPPLTVNRKEIDQIVEIVDRSISEMEAEFGVR